MTCDDCMMAFLPPGFDSPRMNFLAIRLQTWVLDCSAHPFLLPAGACPVSPFFGRNYINQRDLLQEVLSVLHWFLRNSGNSGNKIWQGNQPIFIPIPAEFRWDLNSAGMVPGISGTEWNWEWPERNPWYIILCSCCVTWLITWLHVHVKQTGNATCLLVNH